MKPLLSRQLCNEWGHEVSWQRVVVTERFGEREWGRRTPWELKAPVGTALPGSSNLSAQRVSIPGMVSQICVLAS